MEILLFHTVCLYDSLLDETTIYGQYRNRFDSIELKDTDFTVTFCADRSDFFITMKGKVSTLDTITFVSKTATTTFEDIHLQFPFMNCDLKLSHTSAIISTLCKDYSHRLDEWIQYNIQIGFSGIVIFNNDANKSNTLNESLENCIVAHSTDEICKKYKGRVWVVDFPYSPLNKQHWNSLQRITLHIGVNAFRHRCKHIALIDADEFIHIPTMKPMNIETFLTKYSTITLRSNILTNKNDNDILDNNILELAKYIGEDKYTKTILHTEKVAENEFIITPHRHHSEIVMRKEDILHYHCWMNKRYKYTKTMSAIDFLKLY